MVVTSSLAGRVSRPRLPVGKVRVGGFGGVQGFAGYVREHAVHAVVDATHPFAERMSWTAAQVCEDLGVPRLMLRLPGYVQHPADQWVWVDDVAAAAQQAASLADRVLVTTGRQGLAAYVPYRQTLWVVRCVEPPEVMPERAELLLSRGPYEVEAEAQLLAQYRVGAVVSKDSGGDMTVGKLVAARQAGVPVVMVRRPMAPPSQVVSTVAEAAHWVKGCAGGV